LNRNNHSLALWDKYGDYLLMAMPYADSLISEAQGCTLTDVDGNQLLDLAAGQFCSIVGHNHPKLIEKITEQMKSVLHVGTQFLSPIVLESAEKLAAVAPGKLRKSLLLSTGTEANECAINIAKIYTGKTGMVGFSRGYYGLSLATKSLTNIFSGPGKTGDLPRIPETERLLTPYCFRCPVHNRYPECNLACLGAGIEAGITSPDNLAAIIVEPIVSAGGMIVPPPGYLKALKEFAQEHEILLIADEAQTGFGRTGKWFGIEHHGVEPDILVVSKGAGGGYPVSGLITTDEIAEAITSKGFGHLASHQSDPPAAAAVAAVIDIVREEGLAAAAEESGRYFVEGLRALQSRHSVIAEIRGRGLMLGIELADPEDENRTQDLAPAVTALCRSKGVHLTYTYFQPVLRIIPPLTISRQQIDTAITALDEALRQACQRDFRLERFLPINPYSRPYIDKLRGKRNLKNVLSRLYATSPQYWLRKFREVVRE
jgi:2,2-dialkylglycine decarboxylase (pyruvate)